MGPLGSCKKQVDPQKAGIFRGRGRASCGPAQEMRAVVGKLELRRPEIASIRRGKKDALVRCGPGSSGSRSAAALPAPNATCFSSRRSRDATP
jgi:hypothetical protein